MGEEEEEKESRGMGRGRAFSLGFCFLLTSCGPLVYRTVWPTFKACVTSFLSLLWKYLHRHIQWCSFPFYLKICICACAHLSIRLCTTQLQKRAEEGIISPETRVTVIWTSPDVGARTQIWVLHKNVQMLLAAEPSLMSPRCF